MAKNKLSTRIANAVRALRGEPWPAVIEGPKITYTRPAIQTIGAEVTVPIELFDLQGPEVTDAEARRDIARLIGQELLEAGAIKIRQETNCRTEGFHCTGRPFFTGYLRYTGGVWVVMPEKEDDTDGQE